MDCKYGEVIFKSSTAPGLLVPLRYIFHRSSCLVTVKNTQCDGLTAYRSLLIAPLSRASSSASPSHQSSLRFREYFDKLSNLLKLRWFFSPLTAHFSFLFAHRSAFENLKLCWLQSPFLLFSLSPPLLVSKSPLPLVPFDTFFSVALRKTLRGTVSLLIATLSRASSSAGPSHFSEPDAFMFSFLER